MVILTLVLYREVAMGKTEHGNKVLLEGGLANTRWIVVITDEDLVPPDESG